MGALQNVYVICCVSYSVGIIFVFVASILLLLKIKKKQSSNRNAHTMLKKIHRRKHITATTMKC